MKNFHSSLTLLILSIIISVFIKYLNMNFSFKNLVYKLSFDQNKLTNPTYIFLEFNFLDSLGTPGTPW